MNNILKKLFKMLATSIVIFCLALVGTLILNVIKHFCPILFWIIGISMLLFGGYFFGNKL